MSALTISHGGRSWVALFRIKEGSVRYERSRMLVCNARGKASVRGVIRMGASPAEDDRRIAVLLPTLPSATVIAEIERMYNSGVVRTYEWRAGSQNCGVE